MGYLSFEIIIDVMMCCWKVMKSVISGMIVIVVVVIISVYWLLNCDCRLVVVIVRICYLWLLVIINGYMKLFYCEIMVIIVKVVRIGWLFGIIICMIMFKVLVLLRCVVLIKLFGMR